MSAYVVGDINVFNSERYEQYRIAMLAAVNEFGGRYLVKGGDVHVIEGTWNPARIIIIEFAELADALRFYDSTEFAHARALRQNVAMVNLIVVDGVAPIDKPRSA